VKRYAYSGHLSLFQAEQAAASINYNSCAIICPINITYIQIVSIQAKCNTFRDFLFKIFRNGKIKKIVSFRETSISNVINMRANLCNYIYDCPLSHCLPTVLIRVSFKLHFHFVRKHLSFSLTPSTRRLCDPYANLACLPSPLSFSPRTLPFGFSLRLLRLFHSALPPPSRQLRSHPRRRHQQTSWLYRESRLDYESWLEAGRLAHRSRREVPFFPFPTALLLTSPSSFTLFLAPGLPFLVARLCHPHLRDDGEHTNTGSRLVVFACEINAFLFRSELNASLHKETAIYSFILWGWTGKGLRRQPRREEDESLRPSIHPNRVFQTLSQSERMAQSFLLPFFSRTMHLSLRRPAFFPSKRETPRTGESKETRGRGCTAPAHGYIILSQASFTNGLATIKRRLRKRR